MCENFNIQVITTAGYSPWRHGLLERHNQTLTEILLKVKHDHNLDWETALNWALMTKNASQNVHGYSPYLNWFLEKIQTSHQPSPMNHLP